MTARSTRLVHELVHYPRVNDWMARMRAFGHGTSFADDRRGSAARCRHSAAGDTAHLKAVRRGPPIGNHVRADDYGRDPVDGELVLIDADEIALHRRDSQLGDIVVHFPRLGYDLRPA